jgi:hypothetical protein
MVVEDVSIEVETSRGKQPVTSEVLVLSVGPKASRAGRCSRCRRRCPGYDSGGETRRWHTLDVGTTKAYLQAAVAGPPWRTVAAIVTRVVVDRPWHQRPAIRADADRPGSAPYETQPTETSVEPLNATKNATRRDLIGQLRGSDATKLRCRLRATLLWVKGTCRNSKLRGMLRNASAYWLN